MATRHVLQSEKGVANRLIEAAAELEELIVSEKEIIAATDKLDQRREIPGEENVFNDQHVKRSQKNLEEAKSKTAENIARDVAGIEKMKEEGAKEIAKAKGEITNAKKLVTEAKEKLEQARAETTQPDQVKRLEGELRRQEQEAQRRERDLQRVVENRDKQIRNYESNAKNQEANGERWIANAEKQLAQAEGKARRRLELPSKKNSSNRQPSTLRNSRARPSTRPTS